MKVVPEYAENIIVAVIHNQKLCWYVTDKEIWYLDYAYRIKQFEEKGYAINLENIDNSRKGLLILDTANINEFKQKVREYEVKTEELREYLEKEKSINKEWFYDLSPSLYIDFDRKILYSSYRELDSYESYIPNGWNADFKDFLGEIPPAYRYWVNYENVNYFLEMVSVNEK